MTKKPQITPAEASWMYRVIECVTGTQERKSEERIRQSVFRKLGEIARDGKSGDEIRRERRRKR